MIHRKILLTTAALALVASVPSAAEPTGTPISGTLHRLSPEEVQAVQETAARRNASAGEIYDRSVPDGRIHGEIGFEVGSGGYTSVFGTTVVPLGSDGFAAFSFERSDFGRRRFRY